MLLEITGEITPERMKRRAKAKQHPVVDVTGDRSKVLCCKQHRNLECQVHESRQTGSGQTGDGKSEYQHARNQRTEMDWNR